MSVLQHTAAAPSVSSLMIPGTRGPVPELSSSVLSESSSLGTAKHGQKHTPTQLAPNRDGHRCLTYRAQLRPTEQYLSLS